MSKFKVGDRIRRIDMPLADVPLGFETVVQPNAPTAQGRVWYIDGAGCVVHGDEEIFELVTPAEAPTEVLPVRTVTRQEIVPGVYGRLMVDRGLPAGGTVLLGINDGPDTDQTHWTATELRAAARVFVSLAEALEQKP